MEVVITTLWSFVMRTAASQRAILSNIVSTPVAVEVEATGQSFTGNCEGTLRLIAQRMYRSAQRAKSYLLRQALQREGLKIPLSD